MVFLQPTLILFISLSLQIIPDRPFRLQFIKFWFALFQSNLISLSRTSVFKKNIHCLFPSVTLILIVSPSQFNLVVSTSVHLNLDCLPSIHLYPEYLHISTINPDHPSQFKKFWLALFHSNLISLSPLRYILILIAPLQSNHDCLHFRPFNPEVVCTVRKYNHKNS